jgi:hypothetical protein
MKVKTPTASPPESRSWKKQQKYEKYKRIPIEVFGFIRQVGPEAAHP